MALKWWQKIVELGKNNTKLSWNCDSDKDKGKYNGKILTEYGSLFNAWKDWFSLRILIAGERRDVTGDYLKEAPHLNKKYDVVISYWTLVREFCMVNGKCSNLCCIMNTLRFKITPGTSTQCTPPPPMLLPWGPLQCTCIIVQFYYWTV